MGRRALSDCNSFAVTHPDLASEWHPTKNEGLTPFDVMSGSHKSVWWICSAGEDHEWKTSVKNRVINGSGCGVCDGKVIVRSNSLGGVYPNVACLWHPVRNELLTPFDVSSRSGKVVWWQCLRDSNHEYLDTTQKRVLSYKEGGVNCPICYGRRVIDSTSLAENSPIIASEWHPIKNGNLTPWMVAPCSNKKVWWQCSIDPEHEWKTDPNHRVGQGRGCPYCFGSHGADTVASVLDKIRDECGIQFKREGSIEGCRNTYHLRFDFVVYENNVVLGAIEYNGRQHYEPVELFGGEKAFELCVKRDNIKREFCKSWSISYLEISYKDFNKIELLIRDFVALVVMR